MSYVVLLGDSISDTAAYMTAGAPDIVWQVRQRLPCGSEATLAAIDGKAGRGAYANSSDTCQQTRRTWSSAPVATTRSTAVTSSPRPPAPTPKRSWVSLTSAMSSSVATSMLAEVLTRGLPTAICTVYYPRFPEAVLQRMAVTALTVFNDCIVRAAFAHGLPLLDLRLICTEEGDYANPIESSLWVGEKIAWVMVELVEYRRRRQDRGVYLSIEEQRAGLRCLRELGRLHR